MKRIGVKSVVLVSVFTMLWAKPAQAYVDPNTGGMLFQMLAVVFTFFTAILLFLSAHIRMSFARFMRFVRGWFNR